MGSFKSTPEHYDIIKNIDNPLVTWEDLVNYEGALRTRLDLKTDVSVTQALTARVTTVENTKEDKTVVAAIERRVSTVETTKANQTDLDKTNRNLEEVNNKATHNSQDLLNLHDDIEGVRSQYTALTGSINTLQTKFGELNAYSGKVDVLQGDISDLWDQVNNMEPGSGTVTPSPPVEGEVDLSNYFTKTEANARFALKTSLNSYLTKSEAERTYAQNAELEELQKQLEKLQDSLKPIGTIHVNINTSNATLSKATVAIRNTYDTEEQDGKFTSQQEKALVNGEITFTNIKQGDWKGHSWRVGYKKAWENDPDHLTQLSSTTSFSMSKDTAEFTSLPFGYFEVTNNSGIDFDYFTYTTSAKTIPKSGIGYRDEDTNEWINTLWKNGAKKTFKMTSATYYDKDVYIVAVNNTDQNKYWRSAATHMDMGTYKSLTVTKGELETYEADPGSTEGPEIMDSEVSALRDELNSLREQLNEALSAKQVEPNTGIEGPSF